MGRLCALQLLSERTYQQQLIMQLSTQSVSKIADALKPAVLEYIYADEGFTEYMQTTVTEGIRNTMGDMDQDLLFEIGMLIFDRIELK